MLQYEQIVFCQGDDAVEPLAILDEEGTIAAINHLAEWYNPGEHEVRKESSAGNGDYIGIVDDPDCRWILNYSLRYGYIGLQRRTEQ